MPKKTTELEKLAASVYAQTVSQLIEKLSCPKEQKIKLYNVIIEAHRLSR